VAVVRAAGGSATGYLLVLLAVGCFVINAGVARLVLTSGIGATELSAIRAVGTALVLLLAVLATGRARMLRVSRHEAVPLVAYGVVGVALLHMTYFVAIERLPIGLALLLEYLAPVLVALWVRLVRHEQVRRTLWPALGLCLVGLALVAQIGGAGDELDPLGLLAGFGAAVCFATYFLLGERLVAHRDPVSTTFWGFTVAAVLWSVVVGWWTPLGDAVSQSVVLPGALGDVAVPLVALVVWVVVLGTLVPFAAATAALRHLPATTVTVVAILEPVGAAMLAWWWFDENLTLVQLVGIALVIAGIVLALRARRVRSTVAVTGAVEPDVGIAQG
jgi:drug/metabolite transporter (DMT)-like permease